MWPDQPYAGARGSFLRPVPVFTEDPDATPHKTFTIPCSYLPYVRGALQQLLLQATWATDDPAVLQLAQDRASTLISMFDECSEADLPFACSWDFNADQGPFEDRAHASGDYPPASAFWDFALGAWASTDHPAGGGVDTNSSDIVYVFPADVRLTAVSFSYALTKGPFPFVGLDSGIILYSAGFGSVLSSNLVGATTLANTSIGTFSWGGDVSGVRIVRLIMTADAVSSGGPLSGGANIFSAAANGIGVADCGS